METLFAIPSPIYAALPIWMVSYSIFHDTTMRGRSQQKEEPTEKKLGIARKLIRPMNVEGLVSVDQISARDHCRNGTYLSRYDDGDLEDDQHAGPSGVQDGRIGPEVDGEDVTHEDHDAEFLYVSPVPWW